MFVSVRLECTKSVNTWNKPLVQLLRVLSHRTSKNYDDKLYAYYRSSAKVAELTDSSGIVFLLSKSVVLCL